MLIAVPLYKLLIEWHLILENVPVLVLVDHTFVMLAQDEIIDSFVLPGILTNLL